MIRHIDKSLHDLMTLSFASFYDGRQAKVTVSAAAGHFDVQLDGIPVGQVAFDQYRYMWYLAEGELSDTDLVYEIGERIEARYN